MVKYIYNKSQKVCFWKITRPLFIRKWPVFASKTAHFSRQNALFLCRFRSDFVAHNDYD